MRRRASSIGAREALIANAEQMHEVYGHIAGPMFLEQARRLRDGGRASFHGWEIADVTGIDPHGEYLLDSDDSLTEV